MLVAYACKDIPPGMPKWDGEFLAADHESQSVVVRPGQPDELRIKASDPQFSEGAWVSYRDIGCLYQQLINNCKEWVDPNLSCNPIRPSLVRRVLMK